MTRRMENNIERGRRISVTIDGKAVTCFEGETIATVLLASDRIAFRETRQGRPRGPVCNMGVCFECMVEVSPPADPALAPTEAQATRRRACMTKAAEGQHIFTTRYDRGPS